MSWSVGLIPRLGASLSSTTAPTPHMLGHRLSAPLRQSRRAFHSPLSLRSPARSVPLSVAHRLPPSHARASRTTVYTIGLGLSFLTYQLSPFRRPVQCDSPASASSISARAGGTPRPGVGDGNPPPGSVLSLYELGFGTVAGICAGVFLKKGLKAIAFLLGGAFVLLQYLSSKSFITVDWARMSNKYDQTFGTRLATGGSKAPTVTGAWNWIVDFVTANFQQRASFLAGFLLGVRLG